MKKTYLAVAMAAALTFNTAAVGYAAAPDSGVETEAEDKDAENEDLEGSEKKDTVNPDGEGKSQENPDEEGESQENPDGEGENQENPDGEGDNQENPDGEGENQENLDAEGENSEKPDGDDENQDGTDIVSSNKNSAVEDLEDLIKALPSQDEFSECLESYENDEDGAAEYIDSIREKVEKALDAKAALSGEELYEVDPELIDLLDMWKLTVDMLGNSGITTFGSPTVQSEVTVANMTDLKEAIDEAADGAVITLSADITDAVGIAVASGKNFTLDFAGHNYTLIGPGAGSTGTETNGFQLLKGSNIKFKNGTIEIASNQTGIKRIIQNYANLTLENMTFYTENQAGGEDYALSFNNGTITFSGDTSVISSDSDVIAFDVYYWASSYPGGVKVTFDESYNGTITGKILYDSTDSDMAQLVVNGSGNFGSVEKSSASCDNPNIKIYGGTFENKNLPKEYLADGLVLDGEGNVISKETGIYQASNETELSEALKDGIKNIQLANNISLSKMLDIAADGVTLDLNGHTITAADDFQSSWENKNDAHLVQITGDSVTVKNGTLKTTEDNKHTLNVYEAEDVELESVILNHDKASTGAPLVINASEVTMSGDNALICGRNSWYGINVDSKGKEASLTFGEGSLTVRGIDFSDTTRPVIKTEKSGGGNVSVKDTDNVGLDIETDADGNIVYVLTEPEPEPTPEPTPTPDPVPDDKPSDSTGSSTGSSGGSNESNKNVISQGTIYADGTVSGNPNLGGMWKQDSTGWWYERTDGSYPVNVWAQLSWNGRTNWYHFNAAGYLDAGWFTDSDGNTYYLHDVHDNSFGYMYTGWNMINGKYYYFFAESSEGIKAGSLAKGTVTPDGYRVDENGVWAE